MRPSEISDTVEKNKRQRNRKSTRKNPAIDLPDFLPGDLWQQFRDHRTAMRATMTQEAERRLLHKLEGFRANGHDIRTIIGTSIERGWKGLFEPTREEPQHGKASEQRTAVIHTLTGGLKVPHNR